MTPSFSIIVAAGGESSRLGALIDHVRSVGYGQAIEIIACGETPSDSADRPGVRRATIAGGLAARYNAGAALAFGDILMFLDAQTRLPVGAFDLAGRCLAEGAADAGAFGIEAGCAGRAARLIVRARSIVSRLAGRPLRDQAVFMRRDLFARLGGFRRQDALAELELLGAARRAGATIRVLRARARVPGEIHDAPGGTLRAWRELLLIARDMLTIRIRDRADPGGGVKAPNKGKTR